MAAATDVGRVVASPYRNDSVQLGVQYGADGLYDALFIVVYIWHGQSFGSYSKVKSVRPFREFAAARKWIDENHAAALRDYLKM